MNKKLLLVYFWITLIIISKAFFPSRALAQRGSSCSPNFSPAAFQGRTGRVAFYNQWNVPVTIILYHPNSNSVYDRYTVPPGQNQFLGNNIIVGDDWGVCFEIKGVPGLVNNVGTISDYNPNYQGSPLFMIQNSRINRETGGQVCGGFAGISCPTGQTCVYPVSPVEFDAIGVCR